MEENLLLQASHVFSLDLGYLAARNTPFTLSMALRWRKIKMWHLVFVIVMETILYGPSYTARVCISVPKHNITNMSEPVRADEAAHRHSFTKRLYGIL